MIRTVWVIGIVSAIGIAPIAFDATLEATATTGAEPQPRLWQRYRAQTDWLPPELHRIATRSAITRAELAVLLSVRFYEVIAPAAHDRVVILTDTRHHWADSWVQTTARAGVMTPNRTHRFEPDELLQRYELAEAMVAVLELASEHDPSLKRHMQRRHQDFADLKPTHISYWAAAAAVSAGVIDLRRGGFFFPTATVHGSEALETIRNLARLASG